MNDEIDLMQQAVGGDYRAFLDLMDVAIARGVDGKVPKAEALAGAEIYARLAAVLSDEPEPLRVLSIVLFARAYEARAGGDTRRALQLEIEGQSLLASAAERGDELAAGAFAECSHLLNQNALGIIVAKHPIALAALTTSGRA